MNQSILLLTVDSLRADRVGATTPEGWPSRNLTPNIDAIAADGTTFIDAFSTGPGTRQSFPGILTSTPPLAYGGYNRLGEGRPTLAEHLKEQGYTTGAVHSNAQLSATFGYDRGFDAFYDRRGDDNGGSDGGADDSNTEWGFRNCVGDLISDRPVLYRTVKRLEAHISGITRPYASATEIRESAIEWARDQSMDVFLWVHFMDVHVPYYPPRRFRNQTDAGDVSDSEMVRLWLKLNTKPDDITASELETLERLYDATVRYVDHEIGRLVEDMERETDGCLVIAFASDHGDEFREHGGLTHSPQVYDELVHVPLIFRFPDGTGEVWPDPVSLLDIAPTLTAWARGETTEYWGINLLDDDSPDDRAVFSEVAQAPDDPNDAISVNSRITGCRTDRFTLIVDDLRGREELYDRMQDPQEQHCISDDTAADGLRRRVAEFRSRVDETSPHIFEREISSSIETRLKDLGYMQGESDE